MTTMVTELTRRSRLTTIRTETCYPQELKLDLPAAEPDKAAEADC